MGSARAARLLLSLAGALAMSSPPLAGAQARAASAADFPDIGYATWSDREPEYRLYPGDQIDIAVPSAPELDKSLVVQPDGRVTLPLIPPVMAAGLSVDQLERALAEAYSTQLRHPDVSVTLKAAGPLKVFVGGEVDKPGVYEMEGDMDALRAVIAAGGFKTSAKENQVVIIRRGPGGRRMMRTADLRPTGRGAAGADLVPLRRFDIIYVPRSSVAEAGLFVQQYFRDLLPGQFGFSYSLGGQGVYSGVP